MKKDVVVYSYLIVGGSIGLIILSLFLRGPYYNSSYNLFSLDLLSVLILVGVSGLVLGPYFALAGFIAKENSVWFEANRMIHRHISFPILGGFLLYFASFSYGFLSVIIAYLVVVVLGTLISVMASKGEQACGTSSRSGDPLAQTPSLLSKEKATSSAKI